MRFYSRKLFLFILVSIILALVRPANVLSKTADAILYVNPPLKQVEIGEEFEITISVMDIVDLYAFELFITFPAEKVEVISMVKGDFLKDWSIPVNEFDNDIGSIEFALSQGTPTLPISGDGDLLKITFKAKPGLMFWSANIVILEDSVFSDADSFEIDKVIENGIVFYDNPYQIFLPLILK